MNVKKPPVAGGHSKRAEDTDTPVNALKIYNHFPLLFVLFTNWEKISAATKTTFNNRYGWVV